MEHSRFFIFFLLVGIIHASPIAPESKDDETMLITKNVYSDPYVVYTGTHDIVSILVPTNEFNFGDNAVFEKFEDLSTKLVMFFVEADIDAAGNKDYKGLYIFKDGKATKILENGRDIAASSDTGKDVFFSASDGIYKYDSENNKAVKYGTVDDDIIAIAKDNATDAIYYLNANHELYKVTESGQKKEKVEEVEDAQDFVMDFTHNIYFYAEDKKPYVLSDGDVQLIQGLPEKLTDVKLIRPMFAMDDSVIFLADNVFYVLNANATSDRTEFKIADDSKPNAYGMDASLVHYFAHNKKIYRYNLLTLIKEKPFKEFEEFLKENEDAITIAFPGYKSS